VCPTSCLYVPLRLPKDPLDTVFAIWNKTEIMSYLKYEHKKMYNLLSLKNRFNLAKYQNPWNRILLTKYLSFFVL
jgi:hypothetical protein